jgi:hypothetical protein
MYIFIIMNNNILFNTILNEIEQYCLKKYNYEFTNDSGTIFNYNSKYIIIKNNKIIWLGEYIKYDEHTINFQYNFNRKTTLEFCNEDTKDLIIMEIEPTFEIETIVKILNTVHTQFIQNSNKISINSDVCVIKFSNDLGCPITFNVKYEGYAYPTITFKKLEECMLMSYSSINNNIDVTNQYSHIKYIKNKVENNSTISSNCFDFYYEFNK